MRGQWIGKYSGSNEGAIIVNIDETPENFVGVAYVRPTDNKLPSSAAHFFTDGKSAKQKVEAYLNPVNPGNGLQCEWDAIKNLYGNIDTHSKKADVSFELQEGVLKITAITDIGFKFSSEIRASRETNESLITGNEMSWGEFKSYITQKHNFLFRGQQSPWGLRTAFHRHGRYHMGNFIAQDVKQLHRRLSAITNHYFDLLVPDENGAFFQFDATSRIPHTIIGLVSFAVRRRVLRLP